MDRPTYRELTPLEMEIVTGGTVTLEKVIVWGWNNPYDVTNRGGDYNWQDYYDVPSDGGYSGGGGDPDEYCTCVAHTAQEVEDRTDALASKLARDILAKADYQNREYVAVIYRTSSGGIAVTQLYPGNMSSAPLGSAIAEAGGAANVIGVVHNHPQAMVNNSADPTASAAINQLPSDGDWSNAASVFGNRTDVAYYVLGPDGVLREYEYADRTHWDARNEYSYWRNHQNSYNAGPTVDPNLQPPTCPAHG